MKRILPLLTIVLLVVLFSCEKETMLTVDQTALSYTDAGGSSSITLTANKPWSATSNQSWCKVSPSGGEEATGSRISITCDANTTYDARNATVTITCAELTKQVSITQATNNGLLVSQTSYELTKAAQQLSIQVQANVKFSVEVDNACKDWIKYNSTKSLSTSTVVLDIAENKSYDAREGKVTIKQEGGNLSSTVTIKQSQLDGLFITTPEYNLSNEKHTLTVEVNANIDFEVMSDTDWIVCVETKGLVSNTIILSVDANLGDKDRTGHVRVKQISGDLEATITIKQGRNPQKDALIAIYKATGGDNWIRHDNWCTDMPVSQWYGIYADEQGNILELNLSNNNLTGTIPDETGNLTKLKYGLWLNDNDLSGPIPESIGNLKDLEGMNLGGNPRISGTIPSSITNLTRLKYLNLSYTSLTGSIPEAIGNLADVEQLWLNNSNLSGAIPSGVWDLCQLHYLCLRVNQLSGTIPQRIGNLSKLEYLDLANNNISGTIPESLFGLSGLDFIDLSRNRLSGSFPKSMASLKNLRILAISENALTGSLPDEIGGLTQLEGVWLNENKLSGTIPETIGNLSRLTTLDLHRNNLTGTIPDSFVKLSELNTLDITGNRLNGTLSETLVNSEWWTSRSINLSQQSGYKLKYAYLYESSDYSRDGEVEQILKHKKGKGCKVVITGVAFSDRQIENGRFKEVVNKATETLFSREPFTTFKDYFDVYSVAAVSRNEVMSEDLAYDATYVNADFNFNPDKVMDYVRKVKDITPSELEYTCVLLIQNCRYGTGAYCLGRICTGATAEDADGMSGWIIHEFGHAFGRLADEYVEGDEQNHNVLPDALKLELDKDHSNYENLNVDYHSDPQQVAWKVFLDNPDYDVEGLGIFEGGWAIYRYGVYRPSRVSIMGGSDVFYNAPSRWSIYRQIMENAGVDYSFQDFLDYDKKNLEWFAKNPH